VLDLLVVSDDVVGRLDGHVFKRIALRNLRKAPAPYRLTPSFADHSSKVFV